MSPSTMHFMHDAPNVGLDEEALVRATTDRLAPRYRDLDGELVERAVRASLAPSLRAARVTVFVSILVERRAREALDQIAATARTA